MIIYVDGSAHPTNPGPGGFGVVVLDNNENLLYNYNKQYEDKIVSNNQMELLSILYVLANYGEKDPFIAPTVYSDSAYAIGCYTSWMFNWERNNWRKSDDKIPENLDIIKDYYELYKMGLRINLLKVKGHSNNKWNNYVDKLAKGELN